MKPLQKNYDHKQTEKNWQNQWDKSTIFHWDESQPRANTFVIDTPPPTVSGELHMGHIFSYTQADFIARYQRMSGKTVFYPMGFDDNGLPTERLVEKTKKIRATDMPREKFIEECESVAEEARSAFRALFKSVALSVDWRQEYHTISEDCRRISQLSFLDLFHKGHAYRELKPFFWDPVDQTAIAQAEIEDKEVASHANYIPFGLIDQGSGSGNTSSVIPAQAGISASADSISGERDSCLRRNDNNSLPSTLNWDALEKVTIMTTRPELLGACVALMCHPDDAHKYEGKMAVTPLFNVIVPIIADDKVDKEKGTGLVMCCTFGDETDVFWWNKHKLATRVILNKYGKIDFIASKAGLADRPDWDEENLIQFVIQSDKDSDDSALEQRNTLNIRNTVEIFNKIKGKKTTNTDLKSPGAREITVQLLKDGGMLLKQDPITHAVKCAERSGAALELLPTHQWFIRLTDKKEELKRKAANCNWYPQYMKVRIDQWTDGLNSDWCISRQRYFGVPFPIWYSKRPGEEGKILIADPDQLPVNPLVDLPKGYSRDEVEADKDVMDTWATSSVTPQINAGAIHSPLAGESRSVGDAVGGRAAGADTTPTQFQEKLPLPREGEADASSTINHQPSTGNDRFSKLFPADLRPQAHEIIRTWAFYTIAKAHLHEDTVPWHNLMISGWCLAADKTKMSKSKGNVVTPIALIEDKGADAVRYWASTSRLGADTAFSEDLLKIGRKLTTKLWNATQFAAIHLTKLQGTPATATEEAKKNIISESLDLWILSRLHQTIKKATEEFEKFEYCNARVAIEDFFWKDFCDNYLELVKARAYGESPEFRVQSSENNHSPLAGESRSDSDAVGGRAAGADTPPTQFQEKLPLPREGGANAPALSQPQRSAVHTIHHCLNALLKLFAPFIPHITEELFSHIFDEEYAKTGSVHARGIWPKFADFPYDALEEERGIATVSLLEAIRKAKSERGVSIKYPITLMKISAGPADKPANWKLIERTVFDLRAAGNVVDLVWDDTPDAPGSVSDDGLFRIVVEFAEQGDAA